MFMRIRDCIVLLHGFVFFFIVFMPHNLNAASLDLSNNLRWYLRNPLPGLLQHRLTSAAFGRGNFVAVGDRNPVWTFSDGINWDRGTEHGVRVVITVR